jgi:hypothetical protein
MNDADLIFALNNPGLPGSRNPVIFGDELIGEGYCNPSGVVEFTFDPRMSAEKRSEYIRILSRRIVGSYESNCEIRDSFDNTVMHVDGAIFIYCV